MLGGRVEQPIDPPRQDTILAHRAAPERLPEISDRETDAAALGSSAVIGSSQVASPEAGVSAPQPPVTGVATREPSAPQQVDPQPADVDPSLPAAPATPVLRINVNTATAAELDLLPGICPAMAQRIIDERTRNGRFVSLRDLERVRGIGPKTVEKLQGLVVFE